MTAKPATASTLDSVEYDALYQKDSQGQNAYDARFSQPFDKRILPREMELLIEACKPALDLYKQHTERHARPFRILSFGIGSGRDAIFAEWLANELKDTGIKLELIAQDVSAEGLERFKEVLTAKEYESQDSDHYSKNNLSISFVLSDMAEEPATLAERVGEYDFLMSLYGVFSHITSYRQRFETLTALHHQCVGTALISVATMGSPFHARCYNMLEQMRRKQEPLPAPLDEHGVIYVTDWAATTELEDAVANKNWDKLASIQGEYYVCYDLDHLSQLVQETQWKLLKESVVAVKTPPQITTLPLDRQTDILAAQMMTELLKAIPLEDHNRRMAIANSCCYVAVTLSAH